MANNEPINGLIMSAIKSKSESVKGVDNLGQIKDVIKNDSFVVAYLDYKVLIGKYANGSFSFFNNEQVDPKFIQRIRIFNKDEELMLWRSEGKLKGRYRKDNDGDKIDVVDNNQVLFGTKAEEINGFMRLTEERGTEIILPFDNLKVDDNENRIKIKTRNYIGFNEIHQATYVDCRFIEFTFGENNNPLEV